MTKYLVKIIYVVNGVNFEVFFGKNNKRGFYKSSMLESREDAEKVMEDVLPNYKSSYKNARAEIIEYEEVNK